VEETIQRERLDAPSSADAAPSCAALIVRLEALRRSMLEAEARLRDAAASPSARNLVHYLALRRHDLRSLQDSLAALGLSSLGRAEPNVLATVDRVLAALHALSGRPPPQLAGAAAPADGRALLARRIEALFGATPRQRSTRIMVTLPTEAASQAALVRSLVDSGMDVARINCAHDSAGDWIAMATQVRKAARDAGRPVRVLMDLAGPKIRTGPIAPGPCVLKLKPERDAFGVTLAPARLLLRPRCAAPAPEPGLPALEVDADWLARLRDGDKVEFEDARQRRRELRVLQTRADGVLLQCERTAYLDAQTTLRLQRHGHGAACATLQGLQAREGRLLLHPGQTLRLLHDGIGQPESSGAPGRSRAPASVACTLPAALKQVREGERVCFDDGRIGGVVHHVASRWVDVRITQARAQGDKLAADKGINLPDSRLDLPALTDKDIVDLAVVARHADMVGLSFAQSAADVQTLRRHLGALCAGHLGVVLKIETRRAFEHLPEMLLAALDGPAAGVMIARGDLAVECGFERLAEVQEEILWACEASHMPVVWATQVLETLAQTGRPSRAEITDAAMGERADCVMLNKGAHIVAAMHTLDDILRRMQQHQAKKRPLLRALKSWAPPGH